MVSRIHSTTATADSQTGIITSEHTSQGPTQLTLIYNEHGKFYYRCKLRVQSMYCMCSQREQLSCESYDAYKLIDSAEQRVINTLNMYAPLNSPNSVVSWESSSLLRYGLVKKLNKSNSIPWNIVTKHLQVQTVLFNWNIM